MIDPLLKTLLVQSDGKAYQLTLQEAIFSPPPPEAQVIEESTKVLYLGDFTSHGAHVQAWHHFHIQSSGHVRESTVAFIDKLSMEIALEPHIDDQGAFIKGLFPRESNKELMKRIAMRRVLIPIPDNHKHVVFIPHNTPDPLLYHFLVNTDSKQILGLPFGNTYSDGALCMGHTTKAILRYSYGALTKILNGIHAFHQAPWNADLYSENDFCSSLFMFDANGNWNGEWKIHLLRSVSNNNYNASMKDILASNEFQQNKKNKLVLDVEIKRREIHEESI